MTYLWLFLNLVAAAALGGAVGAQRQAAHKPAGLRTHLLVAIGSRAVMGVFGRFRGARVAAGVITGIGFLGAGAIVREGLMTRGLTTAASIWAVSAIGLAVGFGTPEAYLIGALTAVGLLATLSFSDDKFERIYRPRFEVDAWITFEPKTISTEQVFEIFARVCLGVQPSARFELSEEDGAQVASWLLVLHASDRNSLLRAALDAGTIRGIRRIALSEISPS